MLVESSQIPRSHGEVRVVKVRWLGRCGGEEQGANSKRTLCSKQRRGGSLAEAGVGDGIGMEEEGSSKLMLEEKRTTTLRMKPGNDVNMSFPSGVCSGRETELHVVMARETVLHDNRELVCYCLELGPVALDSKPMAAPVVLGNPSGVLF